MTFQLSLFCCSPHKNMLQSVGGTPGADFKGLEETQCEERNHWCQPCPPFLQNYVPVTQGLFKNSTHYVVKNKNPPHLQFF